MSDSSAAYRQNAYALLSGRGLEIGALHKPTPVPPSAQVEYFDAMDRERARQLFPEIPAEDIVEVQHVGELDHDGLRQFADGTFNFVLISHVIEHVANPIKVIGEVFRILRPGGLALIAIPDKHYTYDRGRALTTMAHLWSDYENNVTENDDEHYLDFLRSAGAHVFLEPPENLPGHIVSVRRRREHAHVWDSASCRAMLDACLPKLGINAICRIESLGPENQFEYFGAWEKR